jgi:Spy/CpxP family protein refolding chaperone
MRWKATILVLAVFLLGVVLGGLSLHVADSVWGAAPGKTKLFTPRSGPERDAQVVADLTRELGLTAEQQQQLAASLEETRIRMSGVHDTIRPQLQQIREEGRDRIRAFLTPEQRAQFELVLARLDEERRKRNQR